MEPLPLGQALDSLLPADRRTGDQRADLLAAAREALARRVRNTQDGGAVIAALRELGLSWREIERETGIAQATARRWSEPPETT